MTLRLNASPSERLWHRGERLFAGLVFAFLLLPILIVVPLSFSSGSLLTLPMPGLSLRWYESVFSDPRWRVAAQNSLIIGLATMVLATGLGTLAALGLANSRLRFKRALMALIILPMVVPVVITGVAAFFFFARLGLVGTHLGLILAHTALATPFVVITVSATLQGYDSNLTRAAQSLGARPARAFLGITLPMILPGVLSGALLAFATSFDEIVVVLFMASPAQHTIPRQIFSGIRENTDPSVAAAAVVLIIISALLMIVVEWLRRRAARLQGRP